MQDIGSFIAFEEWMEGEIAVQTNSRRERINPASSINGDLGVDGDDAYELLVHLANETGADFAEFPYDDYFGSEAAGYEMVQAIRRLLRGEKKVWLRLSVRDLATYMWDHGGRVPKQPAADNTTS
jgi:acyl carrier protein